MIFHLFQPYSWLTLAILIVGYVFFKWKSNSGAAKFLNKFPGPYIYPLIDNMLTMNVPNEELHEVILNNYKLYGDKYRVKLGPFNFVVLSNPDDVEKLLSSSTHITKGRTYKLLRPWLGEGLLISRGKKWQNRRKMLTPSFHFKILEDFMEVFNEQSDILVEILQQDFKNGQEGDICKYITACALDIIGDAAMDRKLNSQRDHDNPYVRAVYKACEVVLYRAFRPWTWIKPLFALSFIGREFNSALKTLHDFTDEVIQERKKGGDVFQKSNGNGGDEDDTYCYGKRRLAFLDLLLEAQKNPDNNLSDLDIREEVDTFMFEGHDTTAASLAWTIFLLGLNPQHQAQVHAELDGIFGEERSRPILVKDIAEMKYLEMCIKESLRLFPSVPFISRTITTDLVLDKEFTVPAGTNAVLLPPTIHRNERIFPCPEAFDPERFLPENTSKRHPFAYIPFSAGPRNCIGQKFAMMEVKVVLGNIFRNFRVEAAERLEDVTVMVEVITRPKDGLRVKLAPR